MKPVVFFCLLLATLRASSQKPDPSTDVLGYQFFVVLSDSSNSISCTAVVLLKLIQSTENISLDLASQTAYGKGMKISALYNAANEPLFYEHSNDKVRIHLPQNKTGDTISITSTYSGVPQDGLIISKNKFNQRTFFSDHWPDRAHHWLLCKDHPSDKAAVEFIVTAPTHYQVVSNGVLKEETNLDSKTKLTHWKETADLPVKVMGIGVAEFAVRYEGDVNNIPVSTWVFPANKEKGFRDYSLAREILPFFVKNLGPFPYKKLANIQSKTIFGGMENAGAIFYNEKSVTGNGIVEETIAHEIAHQWFGNMATESEWAHLWLSEGFATYLALLYLENKYGADTLKKELETSREKVINFYRKSPKPVVDTTATNYLTLLNANSYDKGALVLHMLRRQLGDTVFWKGIRNYYHHFAGKNAVTDDFRKVMEEVSGKDLQYFFKQWLYTAGHPKLNVSGRYDERKRELTIKIIQQQASLFRFPLTVRVSGSSFKKIIKKGMIQEKETEWKIPLSSPVFRLTIDPEGDLLYEEVK